MYTRGKQDHMVAPKRNDVIIDYAIIEVGCSVNLGVRIKGVRMSEGLLYKATCMYSNSVLGYFCTLWANQASLFLFFFVANILFGMLTHFWWYHSHFLALGHLVSSLFWHATHAVQGDLAFRNNSPGFSFLLWKGSHSSCLHTAYQVAPHLLLLPHDCCWIIFTAQLLVMDSYYNQNVIRVVFHEQWS